MDQKHNLNEKDGYFYRNNNQWKTITVQKHSHSLMVAMYRPLVDRQGLNYIYKRFDEAACEMLVYYSDQLLPSHPDEIKGTICRYGRGIYITIPKIWVDKWKIQPGEKVLRKDMTVKNACLFRFAKPLSTKELEEQRYKDSCYILHLLKEAEGKITIYALRAKFSEDRSIPIDGRFKAALDEMNFYKDLHIHGDLVYENKRYFEDHPLKTNHTDVEKKP
jgi:hypothetical protein